MAAGIDVNVERALQQPAERRRHQKCQRQAERKGNAHTVDQNDGAIAARHGEGAMGEIDKVHQAKRYRQTARQHEQQHAVGNSVEQNGQHVRPIIPLSFWKLRSGCPDLRRGPPNDQPGK